MNNILYYFYLYNIYIYLINLHYFDDLIIPYKASSKKL